MLKIRGNKIYLTRGDSLFLKIDISDDSGETYEPKEGDRVVFRLKKKASSRDLLVEKEVSMDDLTLTIDPQDTMHLDFTTYVYEIEVITNSDYHFTIIEDEDFEIGKELENHG